LIGWSVLEAERDRLGGDDDAIALAEAAAQATEEQRIGGAPRANSSTVFIAYSLGNSG
jgi:hypothetical protein